MANFWKGPGCLLINGRQLIKPGQRIPEGALTEGRIAEFAKMIERRNPPAPVVQPIALPPAPPPPAPPQHQSQHQPHNAFQKKVGPRGYENPKR